MTLEYVENSIQLFANIAALLVCLFQYISSSEKGWVYGTLFFLCNLLSSYYWTAYLVVMWSTPQISSVFSYFGWNLAYFILLLLVLRVRGKEERKYFHPLMLLPIPLNIWQLTLYLPYGGVVNNVYQVAVITAISCFSLQSICWYFKKRRAGAKPPYIAFAALVFAICECGMWTCSCFDEPVGSLYYPFSFFASADYLVLVWALFKTYPPQQNQTDSFMDKRYQNFLKAAYFAVVTIGCMGGILLARWMRDTMRANLGEAARSEIFNVIPVVLFIISVFITAFADAIILLVQFSVKVAENNKLREARRIAEHSNAAKSEFLANMSHEIRTPINAVLGMNEMIMRESLQARDLPPGEREAVRQAFSNICAYSGNIRSAGSNLLAIINDILDLSKIEAGKLEIVEANYKLSSILNDVSNMTAFKAKQKGLDFRVEVDSALPDGLYGDEVRIRQIITNILNNAVKYTKEGSVVLSVKGENGAAAEEGGQTRLKIAVKDTGVGIRKEDMGKLFEKFERIDLEKHSTVEGSGLGLAIARSLLDQMGGRIEVSSVYGKGSEFTIVLPQKVVSAEPMGNFQEKFRKNLLEAKPYKEAFRAPDARILLVDDTQMNLTVVVSLLKKTEVKIDTAISGAEAIELARNIHYDLVLMDQRMPEMDGTEAMRRIRDEQDGLNRETPFICLTADALIGARKRYLAEGFTDYLTKPIDSAALEQTLINYLPENKVRVEQEEELLISPADHEGGTEAFDALKAVGVDAATGLGYCENSADLYGTVLREYMKGAREKSRNLQKCFEAEDWKNYAIFVHSLKSTSRMIGAADLSEMAAKLEAAADAEDGETVKSGHDSLMARYTSLAEAIRRALGAEDGSLSENAADTEILEFLPARQ